MGIILQDISGQRFTNLVAISFHSRNQLNRAMWLCKCDCGKEKVIPYSALKSGKRKSCGCSKGELISKSKIKHGHAISGKVSREFRIWQGMIQRCTNSNRDSYKDYGGRGITVCDRWLHSFENFYSDMGECPSNKHSLDRYPDNNGSYEPGNSRWATKQQQSANCRSNRWVQYNGENMIVADWARRFNTTDSTILERIKRGLPLEGKVFPKPILCLMNGIYYDNMQEAVTAFNIKYSTFYYKMNNDGVNKKFIFV
jgi:hypothetical protein